ncbi:hypothetical protein XB02_00705, partial [Pantoea ananatis]
SKKAPYESTGLFYVGYPPETERDEPHLSGSRATAGTKAVKLASLVGWLTSATQISTCRQQARQHKVHHGPAQADAYQG